MELLEFKNKVLKLCNVKETKDIGNVLMETVLNHNEDLYNKYLKIVDDTKIGYKPYGNITKQTEQIRNKTIPRKVFVTLFLHWQEIVIASMIVAAVAVRCLLIC